MKIRAKLLAGYVVVILLIAAIGGIALLMNQSTGTRLDEIDDKYWQGSKSAMDFRASVYAMQGSAMCYVNNEPEALDEIDEVKEELAESVTGMENSGLFGQATLDTLQTSLAGFYTTIDEVIAAVDGANDTAIDKSVEEMDEKSMELGGDIHTLVDSAKADMDGEIKSLDDSLASTGLQLLVMVIAVIAFGLVFALLMSRNISKPINQMTSAANDISSGKRDVEFLGLERKDEIGELGKSFDRMINSVKLAMEVMEQQEK